MNGLKASSDIQNLHSTSIQTTSILPFLRKLLDDVCYQSKGVSQEKGRHDMGSNQGIKRGKSTARMSERERDRMRLCRSHREKCVQTEQQISECKEAGLKRGENGSGELSGSLTNKKTVLRAISQTY